ncbi:MAG: hypothetical protein QOD83_2632 [Solirubrobacteraceae bacterium]|nr:hypothetical protein [Solirubrobacteraceae bacterium]
MSWIRRCSLIAVVAAGVLAPNAHAASWSEIPSNTAEDITAIEYQAADRFWFATGAGKIFKRVAGTFQQKATVPGTVFKDIEFQDGGGLVGFAVGTNGVVMRSADAGDTWVPIVGILGGRQTSENDCTSPDQAIADVDSVRFAGSTRAWLVAGGTQIYRTAGGATAANVGSAAAGWQYANDDGATCRISKDIDDLFPIPGSDSVYFISKDFGAVFFSSNALTSAATLKPADAGNGFQATRRVTGDPANPNRQWAVTPDGEGVSYYSRTTDGWSTSDYWTIGNPDRGTLTRAEGVDFNGGTVTAVGAAGMIVDSIDGITFFFDPAGGAVATQNWRAVSLASGADAAVGGTGGKLVVSTNANVIPDIVAPTGTIGGPASANAGQATTFTAQVADNAGGSGVDPAGFGWSVPGLPGQTGASAAFTFPSAGSYTVKLTFRDLAGNSGEARRTVSVGTEAPPPPPPPPPPPTFVFPPASRPPVVGGAARKKGKFVRINVSGSLKPPAGVSSARACTGKIALTVSKPKGKKRTLTSATATLSKTCKYKKLLRVRRTRIGKLKSLKLKVAFKGNVAIGASSVTYTVPVR